MGQRVFEEAAVIVKQRYTVRVLEFKENGKEYTEISVYSKDVTEKNNEDFSDYFSFCFTVKGKADEERKKIDNMSDTEFEEFVRIMTHFIEKKYHIKYKPEEKKEGKKEEREKKEKEADKEEGIEKEKGSDENKVESLSDFVLDEPQENPDTKI